MRADIPSKMTMEVWAYPGEHQTLDDLLRIFEGRILRVDHEQVRVLLSFSEEIVEGSGSNGVDHR